MLGIDPGPKESAVAIYTPGGKVGGVFNMRNPDLCQYLKTIISPVSCEWIESFGMSVGREVFETVFWIGCISKSCDLQTPFRLIPRRDIKLHLCQSPRAKDANIRQALIDKIGPQGTKKQPGPTYGVSKHCWSALAVAVTAAEIAKTNNEFIP